MKRMPFEPPTEYYDSQIEEIDEQICQLIKKRKELSNNNPGFPTKQRIAAWAKEYHFYEDFLNSLFSHFLSEEVYKPAIEPKGFVKNIPILKSVEKDHVFYSVTLVRQFENASVVHFNMDDLDDSVEEMARMYRNHSYFGLSIEGDQAYDCRNEGGGGSGGHTSYTFVVSPALPDDSSTYKLVFNELNAPFQKPTGFQVII